MKSKFYAISVFLFLFTLLGATSARAGVVTNLDDSGPGSLRAAIAAAINGEVITFDPTLTGTLFLTSGELSIPLSVMDITIQGPGANVITIDGSLNVVGSNIFDFTGQSSFWRKTTLSGLTLANAIGDPGGCVTAAGNTTITDVYFHGCKSNSTFGFAGGGGILFSGDSSRLLTVSNCTFVNCISNGSGGAIESMGSMHISNSTFWGNSCLYQGGAVAIVNGSLAEFDHVTISNNYAGQSAGGVYIYTGLIARNSIIADNQSGNPIFSDLLGSDGATFDHSLVVVPGPFGAIVDLGGNVYGVSGLVNPPADHGGTMPTCDLGLCSKAIDRANPLNALPLDQRGVVRPIGAGPDMGAFENPLPAPNQAPVLSPEEWTVFDGTEDTPLTTSAISVADPDACDGWITVTVQAMEGALSVTEVSPSTVLGQGTAVLTIEATVTTVNSILGSLTLTPPADFYGHILVAVEVDDNGYTGTGGAQTITTPYTFAFAPVNDPPRFELFQGGAFVPEDEPPYTEESWAYSILPGPSNENDQTVVLGVIGISNPGLFSAGPAVSNDGTLTFTVAPNAYGSSTVTVLAVDSGPGTAPDQNTQVKVGTIVVYEMNDAPVAKDDYATVTEGSFVEILDGGFISVLANDTDIDSPVLQVVGDILAAPAHGIATISSPGTFMYVHDGGNSTEDSFDYYVCDVDEPVLCDTGTVHITIVPLNDPPEFVAPFPSDPVFGYTGELLTFTLHAQDSDSLELIFGATSALPPGASIDPITGIFAWTPDVWQSGFWQFTFTVKDEQTTDTLTVNFDIEALDKDNDGIPDGWEILYDMNPDNPDSDGDFIADGDEFGPLGEPWDTDEDQIIDPLDDDTDGDGVLDRDEAGDEDLDTPAVDTDSDDLPDYADLDSDGDQILDESDNCRIVVNTDQADVDQDGIGDACDDFNDNDNDGWRNSEDNCPEEPNSDQADYDGDGIGDACDLFNDIDQDGVEDSIDNCELVYNPGQNDLDGDLIGDICDPDIDNDGVVNNVDNCQLIQNPNQEDLDLDYVGDACDLDRDGDQSLNPQDNCPDVYNPGQTDVDQDGIGDLCDNLIDYDGDDIPDADDNCPAVYNPTQTDTDTDGLGDVCDDDDDNDLIPDGEDNCPLLPNQNQANLDLDALGDLCDPDIDGDGVVNENDNCPFVATADMTDTDMDGQGDACDDDDEGDLILDVDDNCPLVANEDQADLDDDGLGDACDADIDGDDILNPDDNCPLMASDDLSDSDDDGQGDVCDDDDDNDQVMDEQDNCPLAFNPNQTNTDQDFEGDACDLDDDNDLVPDETDNCPLVVNPEQEDDDSDGIGDACDTEEPQPEQVEPDPIDSDQDVQVEPEDDTVQADLIEPEDDAVEPEDDAVEPEDDTVEPLDIPDVDTAEIEEDTAEPTPDVAVDTGSDTSEPEVDATTSDADTTPEADVGTHLVLEGGSACSAGATSSHSTTGMLVLAGLLLLAWCLMRNAKARRKMVGGWFLMAVAVLLPVQASAQEVDLNAFDISPFFGDGLVTVRGQTLEGRWDIGLFLDYQNDPLHYKNPDTGDVVRYVVEHQLSAQLFGAVGITKWLDLGLVLPLVGYQSGEGLLGAAAPSTVSIGDLRLVPRLRFFSTEWKKGRFDAAVVPEFTAPTGQLVDPYTGDKGFTATPMVALSLEHGLFGVAANAGLRFRASSDLGSSTMENDLLLRGAVYLRLLPELLTIDAEVISTSTLSNPFGTRASPLEVLGGGRFHLTDSLDLSVGAGMGLTDGPAAPAFRALAGLRFSPSPKAEVWSDRDGDGIPDQTDKCPDQAEDPDGFQDQDGCPDTDNDKDTILDASDKCINDPEDLDGFQDSDGCPDADNDSDKICDPWVAQHKAQATFESMCQGNDKCPDDPEDMDGYQDDDGCPDADHDGDKICDPWVAQKGLSEKFTKVCTGTDQCPEVPETANGYRDEDGCPDELPKEAVLEEKTIAIPLVHFEYDSTKLIPESEKIIKQVAEILKAHPEILKVKVVGHTDSHGTDEYNMALSDRRAKAIVDLLVRFGIAKNRLESEGKGHSLPLKAVEETEEDRQLNRRVEFLILEKK